MGVESCKVGTRKPEQRIYEICLEQLAVRPEESVFLDDLGVNLKAAKALGIRTIKVKQKMWSHVMINCKLLHYNLITIYIDMKKN